MRVEVTKGRRKWFWRLVASNGQVLAVSQKYFSKYNAKRAATRLAEVNGYEVRVV
jgi:uncharacterized protein YegP (UPF0339 family)